MRIITRPILRWPGEIRGARPDSPFTATWTQTQDLLVKEAEFLGAGEVVIQLALDESDIRLDGWPYARAQTRHPGVIVSIESRTQGPLSFPCDAFSDWSGSRVLGGWKGNVRAVALAMEALRKVDRYGITRHGEQYVGWKAIGSGTPMPAAQMTDDDALELLRQAAGWDCGPDFDDPDHINSAYRAAAKQHHPDAGGDPDAFRRITEARDLLLAKA